MGLHKFNVRIDLRLAEHSGETVEKRPRPSTRRLAARVAVLARRRC